MSAWKQLIAANFAGDHACAECHRQEYEAHLRSGHSHTATPMSGIEFRWSYLAHQDRLGITPDHARFQDYRAGTVECYGRPMDAADVRACLACHTTLNPPPQLPIREALYVPNVGCERCHGPRKKHVTLAQQGRAAEVPPLVQYETAESYLAACSQCHRDETSVSPEASPHERVRFQPYGLKRSRCYLESPHKMTCSACHDPHDVVSQDRARYIAHCQQCHQQNAAGQNMAGPCTKRPRGDCIECHMPAVEWTAGIAFHDHWIRVRTDDSSPNNAARGH